MSTDSHNAFKDMSLRFIAEEIGMAFTFISVAATEAEHGHLDRAREVRGKAEQAYMEAEWRLMEARERGWDVGILSERLRDLRNRLDGLEGGSQKVA